jgi:hypothetical protein
MHDIGHGKSYGGVAADDVRKICCQHHMTLVGRIVTRLKSVPEGTGTMFDNQISACLIQIQGIGIASCVIVA